MLRISATAGLLEWQRETRARMPSFGSNAAPCWPSSLHCRGVGTAWIDKIVAERPRRWLPSALSRRNRRLSGECRIKGLEFEAVFFVGLDRLVEQEPDLFDKYLYVGATRAATYLGVTVSGMVLPDRLSCLKESFRTKWAE